MALGLIKYSLSLNSSKRRDPNLLCYFYYRYHSLLLPPVTKLATNSTSCSPEALYHRPFCNTSSRSVHLFLRRALALSQTSIFHPSIRDNPSPRRPLLSPHMPHQLSPKLSPHSCIHHGPSSLYLFLVSDSPSIILSVEIQS